MFVIPMLANHVLATRVVATRVAVLRRPLLARGSGCHGPQREYEIAADAAAQRTSRHQILKTSPQGEGDGDSIPVRLWHEHHEDVDREHDDVDHSEQDVGPAGSEREHA